MESLGVLNRAGSQSEFAALVGITQPKVAQLLGDGILPRDGSLRSWVAAYCDRLREQAAGRMGSGELNVADENAALAKAKREGLEIKNAVARGEFAPVALLTQVMADASKGVADQLDALPVVLAREFADVFTPEMRDRMATLVAKARNEWADSTVSLDVDFAQNASESIIQTEV